MSDSSESNPEEDNSLSMIALMNIETAGNIEIEIYCSCGTSLRNECPGLIIFTIIFRLKVLWRDINFIYDQVRIKEIIANMCSCIKTL